MPFVTLYVGKGCDSAQLEKSMYEISSACENTIENTLLRMVRVSVYEVSRDYIYEAGEPVGAEDPAPTVFFDIGPGRSQEAKNSFIRQITDILHRNLGVPKNRVRAYVENNDHPENFCIDGVVKDFSKKVK